MNRTTISSPARLTTVVDVVAGDSGCVDAVPEAGLVLLASKGRRCRSGGNMLYFKG